MNKVLCPNCGSDNNSENLECKLCKTNLKLNDKYYLKEVIGENNQITYLAMEDVPVIIKELSVSALENWKNEELFKREISVLKSLDHEQIPKLIDEFEFESFKDKVHYLVMEFIDGISLSEKISQKIYSEEDALSLIEELTGILEYLHSFRPPIIHRDIKPSNIMIRNSDKKLILIDFGAVTDILRPEGGSTVVGTYGYMAPEQFMGKTSVQSDYYSLGAIIIKLLTKQELYEIIDISDLGFINKLNISDKMKVILRKLLTLDLNERVKSTKEILNLIKGYRDNTLDLTEIQKKNIEFSTHNLKNKEIKEIKRKKEKSLNYAQYAKNKKELDKIKKDYKKLKEIFNRKLIPEKNEELEQLSPERANFWKTVVITTPLVFTLGMMTLPYYLEKSDGSGTSLLIFYSMLITGIVIIFSFISKKTVSINKKNQFSDFLKISLKNSNIDDELIYLFIEENFGKPDIFFKNQKLDMGKVIIYRNMLKKIEDK